MYQPINGPIDTCGEPINRSFRPNIPVIESQGCHVQNAGHQPCGCVEVTRTIPYIDSSTGVSCPDFKPFRSFSIVRKSCCELRIETDGGIIILPEYVDCYSSCDFDCDVAYIKIMGDCVDDVTILVNGKQTMTEVISSNCQNNVSSCNCHGGCM